jgi:hypothetical protein
MGEFQSCSHPFGASFAFLSASGESNALRRGSIMHIHTTAAGPTGDVLSGFQAAQTAAALRRARELSDAALRLKARTSVASTDDDTVNFATLMATNPPELSQTLAAATTPVPSREAPEDEQLLGTPDSTPAAAGRIAATDRVLSDSPSPAPVSARSLPTRAAPRPAQPDSKPDPVSFWA